MHGCPLPAGLLQMCHKQTLQPADQLYPCTYLTQVCPSSTAHGWVARPYPSHSYDRGQSSLSIPKSDTSMSDYLSSGSLWDTSLCAFSQVLTQVHQPLNLTNSLEPNCPPAPFSLHHSLYSLLLGTRAGVERWIYNFQCRSLHFMREFLCSRNTAN